MKELKVGETYKTRGGWDALIIWDAKTGFYAIHKPETEDESTTIWHYSDGKVADCVFGVNLAPHYEGHPADIILEEKK